MIARVALILALAAVALQQPLARAGGGAAPACTASPPAPATTAPANYTKLVLCESFATMNAVDRGNSEAAGFVLYPASVYTGSPITPAANITHDGTGVAFIDPSGQSGKGLNIAGRAAASPFYVGVALSGGFYAEIDLKFATTPPGGAADWPAFWFANLAHWLNFNCPSVGGAYPYTEVDMFEYNTNGIGNPGLNLNAWDCVSGSRTLTAQSENGWSGSGIDFSIYHTYGFLWVPAAQNGGTGLLKSYFDGTLKASCSYSAGGAPSCDSGKAAGTYDTLESQGANVIAIGAYDTGSSPTTIRNFHLWQAP